MAHARAGRGSLAVRLDAARALGYKLGRDDETADQAELAPPDPGLAYTVKEFGGRQRNLTDRAERCLQGTLRDRALLREVDKLLRDMELDGNEDEVEAEAQGSERSQPASASAFPGYGAARRPGGTVYGGGALSARRASSSLRPGAARPVPRPASAREAEGAAAAPPSAGTRVFMQAPRAASASPASDAGAGAASDGGGAPDELKARRLARCAQLEEQLQPVQVAA